MLGSPNLVSTAWRSQSGDKNDPLSDYQGYKNIYISDPKFENYYINHVSVPNPVVDTMDSAIAGEGVHAQESINYFRTIDLMITKSANAYTSWYANKTKGWGNWRTKSGVKVDDRVTLYMDDLSKIGMTYSQNFGYAWDEIAGSGAIGKVAEMAKKIQNNAAMLAAASDSSMNVDTSTPMGKYQKVPYIKSVEPFKIEPSSLTFSFNFGQAGIFSGEQEVVRPILALARIFLPYQTPYKDDDSGGDWLNLAAPTQAQVYANIARIMNSDNFFTSQKNALFNNLKAMGAELKENFSISDPLGSTKDTLATGAATASNLATQFIKGLYKRIDLGLKDSMEENSTSIILRIGRYQLPPCFPSSVSWNFDFTQVDEYGFPRGGTITFEGLQSPKCGERTDIGLLS
jgi:hypothetical protein